jgi:hypothetical protein
MVLHRHLACALMNLGILSPEQYHQVIEDHGLLAECPIRWDLIDAPDEAILAIGACAAFDALGKIREPTIIFVVAKGAVRFATDAQIAEVAARQAAIPPGYDS